MTSLRYILIEERAKLSSIHPQAMSGGQVSLTYRLSYAYESIKVRTDPNDGRQTGYF